MVDAGVLGAEEHLELLEGELVLMSPQGPDRQWATVRVREALRAAYAAAPEPLHIVLVDHSPLEASPQSLPEPDLQVLRGRLADFAGRHPTGADVLLAVEVAATSQGRDRRKASIYAAAGIPTYWLLDLSARQLEVFTAPGPTGYGTRTVFVATERVCPPGAQPLSVASLLDD